MPCALQMTSDGCKAYAALQDHEEGGRAVMPLGVRNVTREQMSCDAESSQRPVALKPG